MLRRTARLVPLSIFICLLLPAWAAGDEAPSRPKLAFYRSHLLTWDELKIDATTGGKRANLYICLLGKEDAAISSSKWYRQLYRGPGSDESKIYRWTEDDFSQTAEGRAFLDEVHRIMEVSATKEAAFVFTNDEAGKALYERLVLASAEEIKFIPDTEGLGSDFSSPFDDEPPGGRREEEPRPQEPGPVEPSLEQKIEATVRDAKLPDLAKARDASSFDFFKNPLFKSGGSAKEPADVARAWKKVLSKSSFQVRSSMLAQMRWALFVDLWAEVAHDHGIQLELIDSGKRNAYRSDLDVTVYAPRDTRGELTMKLFINDFRQRFNERYGYGPESLDITIHDGDVFMPGVRNDGLSVAEYSRKLRDVVKELRLKVTSGGDATYFPGANLDDVQKRGLRDGKVTVLRPEVEVLRRGPDGSPLETRINKPSPKEFQVSEFNVRGGMDIRGERMQGATPAYDRGAGFANLAQSLEKMFRNGSDHAAIAKLFNRGMAQGAGAGQVNSYYDIHVSDIPEGSLTPEQAAELVVQLDSPSANNPGVLQNFRQRNSKPIYKMRWIMRVFGVKADAASVPKLVMFYDVLEATAQMEADKNSGSFSWDDGGAHYLKKFFEKAKASLPGLRDSPGDQELLRQEAWRDFCDRLMMVMEEGMVKTMREALFDLTDKGKRLNAARFRAKFGTTESTVNAEAAEKLAAQRRVELMLLFEFLNRSPRNADEKFWKDRLEGLVDVLVEAAPDSLREYLRALSEIDKAAMDKYLDRPGEDADQSLARREQEVNRVAKDEGVRRRVSTDEMRRDLVRRKVLNTNFAEAPMLVTTLETFIDSLRTSVTHGTPTDSQGRPKIDPRTGRAAEPAAGGALAEDVVNNLTTPLLLGSSTVDLVRAYVHGGKRGLTEAAVAASFDYLPPTYGVIGVAFEDFSRGRVAEGSKHLMWMAAIHMVGQRFPAVPPLLLLVNITTGTVDIVYSYTTQKITEDMLEQAFRSRPVQGKRAQRNPQKDSADFFDGDTPEFPIFWDNPCVEKFGWNRDLADDRAEAEIRFRTAIWKELLAKGLEPDTADWNKEENRLQEKYTFDLPFYQRLDHLYECYHDDIQAKVRQGFDEDRVLQYVFTKVVQDWFSRQPQGYQLEFNSIFDIGEREGSTRKRMLNQLVATAVHFYKQAEDSKNKRDWQMRERRDTLLKVARERGQREDDLQKRLIAAREVKLDAIKQEIKQLYEKSPSSDDAEHQRVRLQAPNWYVNMSGVVRPERPVPEQNTANAQSSKPAAPATQDDGELPLTLTAAADLAHHGGNPDDWQHEIQFKVQSIKRQVPPSFVPSAEEDALLKETGPDGKRRNDVFTIRLQATGTVRDSKGKLLGQSLPTPVLGYVIAEVPHFNADVVVACVGVQTEREGLLIDEGAKQDGKQETLFVPYEAQLNDKTVRVTTAEKDKRVIFSGLGAGEYTAHCNSLDPHFQDGSKSFKLADPYTAETLQNPPPPNPGYVWVEMKRKPDPPKQAAQANTPKPPAGNSTKPAQKRSGGSAPSGSDSGNSASGSDQQALAACQQLTAQAQQSAGAGDLVSAASALEQAKTKACGVNEPAIDQAIAGAQAAIDTEVKQKAGQVQQLSGQCDFEGALQLAQPLEQAEPGNPALAGLDLALLRQQADAQKEARIYLRQGKAAVENNDLGGAIGFLQSALDVPNLPECMRGPGQSLLAELQARKLFGSLTPQVEQAIQQCNYEGATRLQGQITNINPRTDVMQSWINAETPRIAQLQKSVQEAQALISQATAAMQTATTAAEKHRVSGLVEQAINRVAPCELQLDPGLEQYKPLPDPGDIELEPLPEDSQRQQAGNQQQPPPKPEALPEDTHPPAAPAPPKNQPAAPPTLVSNKQPSPEGLPEDNPRLRDGNPPKSARGNQPSGPPSDFWKQLGAAIGTVIAQGQNPQNPPPQAPPQPPVRQGGGQPPGPQNPPVRQNPPPPSNVPPATGGSAGSSVTLYMIVTYSCHAHDPVRTGLRGATVTVGGASYVTGGGGVAFANVPPGNYNITAKYSDGQISGVKMESIQVSKLHDNVNPANEPKTQYAPGAPIPFGSSNSIVYQRQYDVSILMQSVPGCD